MTDLIGGYRLVRRIGDGERATVYLAYPDSDADDARAVAIKVFAPGVSEESVIEEIEALSRASGEHVVALLDLATAADGSPALILQRLSGGSLGRLLRDRQALGVGEAITILVPLARALSRMHDAGVTHGAIRLETVHFDGTGAPVLMAFGSARLFAGHLAPARREEQRGVVDDLSCFARLAGAVLERVPIAVQLPEFGPGWLETVSDWLFGLGAAEPVRLEPDPIPSAPPARVVTGHPVPDERPPADHGVSAVAAMLGLPDDTGLGSIVAAAARRASRVRPALAQVRTRVWVAAGAVVLALVVALTLIPADRPSGVSSTPQASGQADPSAAPSIEPDAPGAAAVAGDDPVLALPALLAARERCIRDLSVLCLDAVDQSGSAALADDQSLIRGIQDGAEVPPRFTVLVADLRLEERLGDSALISLGDVTDAQPASVLVMKSDGGWRIRDYLER